MAGEEMLASVVVALTQRVTALTSELRECRKLAEKALGIEEPDEGS